MLRDENDILAETLERNAPLVDFFYALDGSTDRQRTRDICWSFKQCAGVWQDWQVPYRGSPTDGWRQFIYEKAVEALGADNWFLLLHGDEVWTFDPEDAIAAAPQADGFEFRLPFAVPRDWDYSKTATEQLTEFLVPGWPEFRMFRGASHVRYDPDQHFLTRPHGLSSVYRFDWPILHYPYRSPEVQRLRAPRSLDWSPENLAAVRERDEVFWDDYRIDSFVAGNEHYNRAVTLGLRL